MEPINWRLLLLLLPLQLSAQTGEFTGSKACYACHSAIYQSFRKTAMGRSITSANEWDTKALPQEASATQPTTGRLFRVFHDASGWHQTESDPGVFSLEHRLEYAVGSGANGVTFLVRRGDYLFQAPLSYYSKARKWDFSPGYEQLDLGFDRIVPEECLNCHAGRFSPLIGKPGAFTNPPFEEAAIGCENCHGPGSNHIKSAGKLAGSIVNPAKLNPRLAENICMNCHQTGETRILQPGKQYSDFRPGQWLFDTVAILKPPDKANDQGRDLLQHYSAMQASRCFRASGGKLSCLTCHDPHLQPEPASVAQGTWQRAARQGKDPADPCAGRLILGEFCAASLRAGYFRAKCLNCHTEQSCRLPLINRTARNPPDDCAGCHMPKRTVLQVEHSALTNHRIPARLEEQVPPAPQTQIDGLIIVNAPPEGDVHLSPIMLLQAYGQLSTQIPAYQPRYLTLLKTLSREQPQNPIVQQALGHKALLEDNFEDAIAHLKLALTLNKPSIFLEMAQAQVKLGHTQEAIEYLEIGVALDPFNAVMQKTLILQYIQSKAYPRAHQLLEQYVETFPEDSFMRSMLAKVSPK